MHGRAICDNMTVLDIGGRHEIAFRLTLQEVCLAMSADNLPAKPMHSSRLRFQTTHFRRNDRHLGKRLTMIGGFIEK